MVSFHCALTIAKILAESYIFLTLLVGFSTKHFLWNLMDLLHISERFCWNWEENTPSQWIRDIFLLKYFHAKLASTGNQWLGNANAFDEFSVYYPKLRGHHMQPCNCFNHLYFIFIVPFQLFAYLYFKQKIQIKGK